MLPIFTTTQVKDGIDSGDLMLDLSDYMKKKDAATKTDINALTAALANKLDATPQHKHQIDDIKQLQNALDGKLDKGEKYSHKLILSDVDSIAYIEAPRVKQLDISANNSIDGYIFYVDPASGDLMITLNDVLIGSYSIAAGKWSFETDTAENDLTVNGTLNGYRIGTTSNVGNYRVGKFIPTVVDDGVMEIGKYIDFHEYADASSEGHDYKVRLESDGGVLVTSGGFTVKDSLAATPSQTKITSQELMVTGATSIANHLDVGGSVSVGGKIEVGKFKIEQTMANNNQPYGWLGLNGKGILSVNHDTGLNQFYENMTFNKDVNVQGKLTAQGVDINAKISEIETILKNHYDALLLLCQKHGMVDGNSTDGDKITPQ